MKMIKALGSVAFLLVAAVHSHAANVVAIGDSLTAEYDTLPDISGFPTEATAYAEVTVDGWESKNWVEIVAALRPDDFNFGRFRTLSNPWVPPRLSGYAMNWGVPGIDTGLYEDFVTVSASDNPLYFTLRQPLENQLESSADRVVIWLGTNDFRANYGPIYDGGSAEALIDGLLDDLERVVDFVKERNPDLQIVIVNIPDIGATPSRKVAHPDPAKRALVSAAIAEANTRIDQLASAKGAAVADVTVHTTRLLNGTPVFFGAVQMIDAEHEDNEPHHLFTRDGLHPNTPLQILIARSIIKALNTAYAAGIPQVSDAEALRVLEINPREPYIEWIEPFNVAKSGPLRDAEADGLTNLIEYAFGLNPALNDAATLPVSRGGAVSGLSGDVSIRFTPDPTRSRHTDVFAQYSVNGTSWKRVPADRVIDNGDGSFTAVVPPQGNAAIQTRVKVLLLPPAGSNVTIASVVAVN